MTSHAAIREYDEYTAPPFDWAGKIPSHWDRYRMSHACEKIQDGTHFSPESDFAGDYLYITAKNIKESGVQTSNATYITAEAHKEIYRRCPVRKDDVLYIKDGATAGIATVNQLEEEISLLSSVAMLRPHSTVYDPRYLAFHLNERGFKTSNLNNLVGGAMTRFTVEIIRQFRLLAPPVDEQEQIARFLDSAVGKIDRLVSKKRELIELLQEKRRALVSRCVTRGLPPDAARAAGLDPQPKLKPSGVDWLGDVPEHWDTVPLKHACKMIRDGTHLPPPRVDDGVPLLSVRNIVNEEFVNRSDDSMISKEDYEQLCKSFVVLPDDVLLAIVGATLGKVAVVKEMPPFHIQRSLCVLRARKEQFDHRFVAYWCRSGGFQDLLWVSVGFSAQPGIYLSSINDFPILRPPCDEQTIIADYIEKESGKLTTLVERIEQVIDHLLEYRSALITAAVTGKIDVREVEV